MRLILPLLLLLFTAVYYASSQICTSVGYETISVRVSFLASTSEYYSYSCGSWWRRRRCTSSRPRYYTSSRYETYIQSKTISICCPGYSGTPPNCPQINECLSFNGGCEYTCNNNEGSYTCSCPTGFYSYSHTGCKDVVECDTNNGGCADICHNTAGSYTCSCHPGYYLSGGTNCYNKNECSLNTDLCTQLCEDTDGGYYCKCNDGYLLASDGYTCNDVPECNTDNGGCEDTCTNTVGSYRCSCGTGYVLASNQHSCNDINECALNTDGCSQLCNNNHGSFSCDCNHGYTLASNGKGCNDIIECNTNNGGCEHTCTNSAGSFTCSCNTGYSLSSGHCSDTNECNSNNGNCDSSHGTCINTVGSYYCTCDSGYSLQSNGRSCSDINECSNSNGGCSQNCHNTNGGYYCSCNSGYVLHGNGKTCNDENECATNNGGCGQECVNSAGSYSCTCNTGYTLASRLCNNINECLTNKGGCAHTCVDTVGSYYCTCNSGYALNSDQRGCTDINECNQGNGGCEQNCVNSQGSYSCSCNSGYEISNSKHCIDINECSSNNGGCQHTCVNTVGSFICQCNDGYTLNSLTCTDINECNTNNGGCEHTCTNSAGSFTCSCNTGYNLDGDDLGCTPFCSNACHHCTSCVTPGVCSCDSGYTGNDCCSDINECLSNKGGCAHICTNVEGSRLCSCNSGYTLASNGQNCNDNNECADDSTNECNQICSNTAGSYVCYCNTGYELESDDTTCVDTNECDNSNGGCNQTCTNTVGSYSCSCTNGYTIDSDSHGCNDKDECTLGTDGCDHSCYNTIGSYTCDCNTGYTLDTNGLDCIDLDECATDNGGCEQTCNNAVGSYNCTCLPGYTLDEDGLGCSDHNECLTNAHACDQHCHNTHNSYYCTCDNGYRLSSDGRSCIDINECAEHSSGCNQICNNTIGSRICSCFTGFQLSNNNRTCLDINECNNNNGGCGHNCTNTDGSYTCSCVSGYELDNNEHSCNDINECGRYPGTCEHTCNNTVGSYFCSCDYGYFLEGNGHNCSDVDECVTNNGGCNQTCVNEIGSFHCLCRSGFTLDDNGLGCTDINECDEHTDGCGQQCHNTIGSFHCSCYFGYRLNSTNNKSCHDINECAEDTDGCEHQCNNTISSYYCSCHIGYSLDNNNHTCTDINECHTDNGRCDQNCTNSVGSYDCSCIIGYVLAVDNHDCNDINECNNGDALCEQECDNTIGSYTCGCFTGYYLESNGLNCTDINECNTDNGGCEHICTNEIGSFECSCLSGYLLESDRLGCMDINECAINSDGCEQNCHNINGSYYCTCNDGYRLYHDNLTCDDINECLENISGCYQICTNYIGGYNCSCEDGYYLDSDDHYCNDVNECETQNGGCEHNCHNYIGSYNCSCRNGYNLDQDYHGCTGQSCYDTLTAPVNGSMNCTGVPSQVTDETCTFWCDYGFTFHNSFERTCQSDHSWTGNEPYCVIKHCPILSPPPNGYIATKPCDTRYSTDCEIDCVDGYYIADTNTSYYQSCVVNTTYNEVYWSSPPVCELTPSCISNPCLNGGQCTDVNIVNYRCDCSETFYKGKNCEIGIVSTPTIPILITNQTTNFLNISAYPREELRVDIITNSEYLKATPDYFLLYSSLPKSYFKLVAYKEGIYTISYNLSMGNNAQYFETPLPIRVIAVDSIDSLSLNDSAVPSILTPGCCNAIGLSRQCPYSSNIVQFKSTCSWSNNIDNNDESYSTTDGVVFASSNGLSLPVSIIGTHLSNNNAHGIINTLPITSYSCSDCRSRNISNCVFNTSTNTLSDCQSSNSTNDYDDSCNFYNFTASQILSLLGRKSLSSSYLSYMSDLLPQWLSLYVTPSLDLYENSTFMLDDYSTILTEGRNIVNIDGCQELELDPNGLYSIIRLTDPIQATVMNDQHMYSPQEDEVMCIAIDLCKGDQSPVLIDLPKSSQNVIKQFSQVEILVNDDWELSFYEARLTRHGNQLDDITLPMSYWDSRNFIDTSTLLLSPFDIRLKMNIYKQFNSLSSLWQSALNVTGYLYYSTQPVQNKIDGLINGTLYMSINTTFSNIPAGMVFTTRNNPTLFSIYNTPNSTFNGLLMKVDYMPSNDDEFFSNIFRCELDKLCPSDVFVNFTQERDIDSVWIHTTQSTLSIAGYSFQRGSLEHFLSLSTLQHDNDTPSLLILSNLTGTQLILNPFVSLKQPEEEPAVYASYWRDGRVSGKFPKVTFSILDTAFTTPLSIDTNGRLHFESDITLLESDNTHIIATSPSGNTWDDFTLNINGSFSSTNPGSFVNTLEQYVYDYTGTKVMQSQERVENMQSQITNYKTLIKTLNMTLGEKQNNLTHLYNIHSNAMNNVTMYSSIVDQVQGLVDTANQSVLDAMDNLQSICSYMSCPDTCVPSMSCLSCVNHMTFNEWGTDSVIHTEQLLQHKQELRTEKTWHFEHFCRIITKIRSWGVTTFGQICSYRGVYSNITYNTGITYYDTVSTSHTEATIIDSHQYGPSQICCHEDMCGLEIIDYKCALSNIGCGIAQSPAFDALDQAEQNLVQPLLFLTDAKINVSIAKTQVATIAAEIIAKEIEYNQTIILLQKVQTQYESAINNLASLQEDQLPILIMSQYLEDNTIQQLLVLDTILFNITISESSDSSSLPITITCTIPLTATTFTVSSQVHLTASLSLIQRDLADNILNNLGTHLQNGAGKRKRSLNFIEPTFNRQEFETKCANLHIVKNQLIQLNESIELISIKSQDAMNNITDTAAKLAAIINVDSFNFTHINFTHLQDQFGVTLDDDTLLYQTIAHPTITNLMVAINTLRETILSLTNSVDENLFLSWQLNIADLYNTQITKIANQSCYGFSDCLMITSHILHELIVDTPTQVIDHSLLQSALLTAKLSLLQLSSSDNLTLNQVTYLINTAYDLVALIEDSNYWCSGLPVITVHPNNVLYVEQGSVLSLNCSADSIQTIRYKWRKDGFTLPSYNTSILNIFNTTSLDEGQYQCTATNAIGTVESHLANVYIVIPPRITLSPTNTSTFEGSDNDGWLACNATGHPIPAFHWLYSSDNNTWSIVSDSNSNELILTKPTLNLEGWYKCVASIGDIRAISSQAYLTVYSATISSLNFPSDFVLFVTKPPHITNQYTDTVEQKLVYKLKHEIQSDDIDISDLYLLFGYGNTTVRTNATFNSGYNYSLVELISDQAIGALPYKVNLIQNVMYFEETIHHRNILFFINESTYVLIGVTLQVQDLEYHCPSGKGVMSGNFICVDCTPGTSPLLIDSSHRCIPCSRGTYGTERGQDKCHSCPENKSTLYTGATSEQDCIDYCSPGFYSTTGLIPCITCPPFTYTLQYGSMTCMECDNNTSNDEIPECFKPIPSSSPVLSPTLEPVDDVSEININMIMIIIGTVLFSLILIVLFIVFAVTVLLVYRRKKKPKVIVQNARARRSRQPEGEYSVFRNPLFVESKIFSQTDSERYSFNDDNVDATNRINPLFQELDDDDEGTEYDSISSIKPVGQFFPSHPSMEPDYDEIEPLRINYLKGQDEFIEEDNFDDVIKLVN